MNGKAMSKVIPMRHRDAKVYLYAGSHAYGSNSTVLTVPKEIEKAGFPNTLLIPDWTTEVEVPWASKNDTLVYRVICEQEYVDDSKAPRCAHVPRAVCRRLLRNLATHDERGLQLLSASEFEFCVANANKKPLFEDHEIFSTLQGARTCELQ
eukprot:IDg19175t1